MQEAVRNEYYELISHWLYQWEKLIKEPNDLLLDRSFGNIVRATLTELNTYLKRTPNKPIHRNQTSYGRNLLVLLEEAFDKNNVAVDLIKIDCPTEIAELRRLLKEPSFNVSAIYGLLELIKDYPSTTALRQEFIKEVLRAPQARSEHLTVISRLLIRKTFVDHGAHSLKELPERALARHGAAMLLGKLRGRLLAEEQLATELWQQWLMHLARKTSFEDLAGMVSLQPDSVFGLSNRFFWLYLTHGFMRQVAETLAAEVLQALAHRNHTAMAEGEQDLLQAHLDADRLRKIGARTVCQYTNIFLRFICDMACDKETWEEGSDLSRLCLPVGDWLLAEAGFADNRPHPYVHRPNIVDLLVTRAFVSTASALVGKRLTDEVNLPELSQVSESIGHKLLVLLREELVPDGLNLGTPPVNEIEAACFHLAARRRTHEELGGVLAPLNKLLAQHFTTLLDALSARNILNDINVREGFWDEWTRSFTQRAAPDKSVLHYLPWSNLDEHEFEIVLSGFFDDLAKPGEEWLTVFIVKDLKPQGKIWTYDDVTFYDPKVFDFGEQRWFSDEVTEATTFVKMVTKADTRTSAAQRGWARLNDVLSAFTFALSADQNWGGFNPEVHSDAYVAQVSTGNWTIIRSNSRDDHPVSQSIDHLKHFADTFRHLLEVARDPAQLTEWQVKLLRALHWYRKGRWETDPAESFLCYWIGLEHLFEENDQDRLSDLLPRLHVTWRDVDTPWWALRYHQQDTIKMIQGDDELRSVVDADSQLKGWSTDRRVLLDHQNVARLLTHIADEKVQIKEYVEDYQDYLQKFVSSKQAILKEVDRLRSLFKFKLLLLKGMRNSMVHQALSFRPDAEVYAEVLEDILEDVIVKIGNDVIQPSPGCNSVRDLIDQYEELWIK
jgi:hypothetical protein